MGWFWWLVVWSFLHAVCDWSWYPVAQMAAVQMLPPLGYLMWNWARSTWAADVLHYEEMQRQCDYALKWIHPSVTHTQTCFLGFALQCGPIIYSTFVLATAAAWSPLSALSSIFLLGQAVSCYKLARW